MCFCHDFIPHLSRIPSFLNRVRKRVEVLRKERDALLEKGNKVVPVQAMFRAFITRKRDKLVQVSSRRVLLLLTLLSSKQQSKLFHVIFQMPKRKSAPGCCSSGVALRQDKQYMILMVEQRNPFHTCYRFNVVRAS